MNVGDTESAILLLQKPETETELQVISILGSSSGIFDVYFCFLFSSFQRPQKTPNAQVNEAGAVLADIMSEGEKGKWEKAERSGHQKRL